MKAFTVFLNDEDAQAFHQAAARRIEGTTDFSVTVGQGSWDIQQAMPAGESREMRRTLGINEASRLSDLISAAERHAKVGRLIRQGDSDPLDSEPVYGTIRAFVRDPETAYFLTDKDDVRDAYLWVTTRGGMEAFWPVSELLDDVRVGYLALDYEPPKGA
jgi:hypothetical protein